MDRFDGLDLVLESTLLSSASPDAVGGESDNKDGQDNNQNEHQSKSNPGCPCLSVDILNDSFGLGNFFSDSTELELLNLLIALFSVLTLDGVLVLIVLAVLNEERIVVTNSTKNRGTKPHSFRDTSIRFLDLLSEFLVNLLEFLQVVFRAEDLELNND